jgi:hypothetical protein
MQSHRISFTYSKKNEVIANNFIKIFNQFNLQTLTLSDLECKSPELEDQLSVLYHYSTFIILLSKNDEESIRLLWEHFYVKYTQEKNIALVPILLESSTDLDIPNSIQPIHFTNNYLECVKTTKQLLSKQKSKFKETETSFYIFHPTLLNDIHILGID